MHEIIKKAEVLIEALPYIQEFRGDIVVIKFGGSAMENAVHKESILTDIVFMECVGMLPVIVHGGGKAISRGMKEHGIESEFLNGFRVTCEESIKVVEKVIKGDVNPGIVKVLEERGGKATSLHGEEVFKVTKKEETDPSTGEKLDWGFVGEPDEADEKLVREIIASGSIPVITPLGMGPDGKVHNINADVAAAAVAKALKARKLVFLSDVPGLLRDQNDPTSAIPTLKTDDVADLIKKGVISGGMLPKVQSGLEAIQAGVKKVHMIDGRMSHSVLLEIFTDKGVGTEIVG